jgi:hypothetical protein
MGYKLHVATTYQVRYDYNVTPFDCKEGLLNQFLHEHCPNMSWEDGRYSCEFATSLEIPKAELGNLIRWITTHRDEYTQWANENGIEENADKFIEIVAYWIANSDHCNDFVALSWY